MYQTNILTYGCELFGLVERHELETIHRVILSRFSVLQSGQKSVPDGQNKHYTRRSGQLRTIRRALNYESKTKNSPCFALRECVKEVERWDLTRNRALGHLLHTGCSPTERGREECGRYDSPESAWPISPGLRTPATRAFYNYTGSVARVSAVG